MINIWPTKALIRIVCASISILLSGCTTYQTITMGIEHFLTDCPADGPNYKIPKKYRADFDQPRISLSDYETSLISYQPNFDVSVREHITFEGKRFKIHEINYSPSSGKHRILIFAATHGHEAPPLLSIPLILEEIKTRSEKYQNWNIKIITPINPVGVEYQARYNQDGCDINRDFKAFRTIGARIQRDTIEAFSPDIIVSLHEAPQTGFMVIAESNVPSKLSKKVQKGLEAASINLADESYIGFKLDPPGLMQKGLIENTFQTVTGMHTLGRYAMKQDIITFTSESSWLDPEIENRIRPHFELIRIVMESYDDFSIGKGNIGK